MGVEFVMTDDEIRHSYKNAADKNKQVGVLAELNAVNKRDMLNKLCQLNLIAGMPNEEKTPSRYSKWTDEDVNKIVAMYEQEHTIKEIASELGRTYEATQKKMQSLGLHSCNYKPKSKTARPPKAFQPEPEVPNNTNANTVDKAIEVYKLLSATISSQYNLVATSLQITPGDIRISYDNKLLLQITELEAIECQQDS